MKLTVNNKQVLMRVVHLNGDEFKKQFPDLVSGTPLTKKKHTVNKVTVAEVTYDNVTSRAISLVHKNDQFNRRIGASRSLHAALLQHPSMNQARNLEHKKLRAEIYNYMFRSEPSPYAQLSRLVKGRPEVAEAFLKLTQSIKRGDEGATSEILKTIGEHFAKRENINA